MTLAQLPPSGVPSNVVPWEEARFWVLVVLVLVLMLVAIVALTRAMSDRRRKG